jgi:hypothetical protein
VNAARSIGRFLLEFFDRSAKPHTDSFQKLFLAVLALHAVNRFALVVEGNEVARDAFIPCMRWNEFVIGTLVARNGFARVVDIRAGYRVLKHRDGFPIVSSNSVVSTAFEELQFFSEDFQQSVVIACHVSLQRAVGLDEGPIQTPKTIFKPIATSFRDMCHETL